MTDWGGNYPDLGEYDAPEVEIKLRYSIPTKIWKRMTPGQKQEALLGDALDFKRELLALPRPGAGAPINSDTTAFRALILRASDSIIDQVLQIEANALHRPPANDVERVIEERRQKALKEIERMG